MSLWVSNTSPLIFLAKLGRLDILRKLAGQVLVPPMVVEEIQHQDDVAARQVLAATQDWLVVDHPSEASHRIIKASLGAGESAAIALAVTRKADRVILDDLDARRFARRLGLNIIGTAGLLLSARLQGDIESLSEEISRLKQKGFFIADELTRKLLAEAGE